MAPNVECSTVAATPRVESDTVDRILEVLGGQLLLNPTLNSDRLRSEIGQKVAAGQKIDMLLPAFPCKSINKVSKRVLLFYVRRYPYLKTSCSGQSVGRVS